MELKEYIELGGWCVAATAGVFAATSAVASSDAKHKVGKALAGSTVADLAAAIPNTFVSIFDALFGRKIFHWRFLLPSIATSVSCVFLVSLIYLSLVNQTFESWWNVMPPDRRLRIISWLILGNLIPDYISLVETRVLLGFLHRKATVLRLALLLVIDLAATAAIFFVCYSIFAIYIKYGIRDGFGLDELWKSFGLMSRTVQAFIENPTPVFPSTSTFGVPIQIWTTFFTSIWLWLFALSLLFLRVLNLVGGGFWIALKKRLLDVEGKPILSIGWVASSLVLVSFIVASPWAIEF